MEKGKDQEKRKVREGKEGGREGREEEEGRAGDLAFSFALGLLSFGLVLSMRTGHTLEASE